MKSRLGGASVGLAVFGFLAGCTGVVDDPAPTPSGDPTTQLPAPSKADNPAAPASATPAAAAPASDAPAAAADPAGFSVFPASIYTGVDDAGNRFSVPVVALGGSAGGWAASNSEVASVSGTDANATITALEAGLTQVSASSGTSTASVWVYAYSYTQAEMTAGASVYQRICSNCHAAGGIGPDLTPSGVGKHSPAQIQNAAQMGQNPEGGDLDQPGHMFGLTGDEVNGIVGYLRSLPARGLPDPSDT